jgi:hypothetical protein
MNKEQQELVGDAFMRYYNSFPTPGKLYEYEGNATDLIKITKEEFINKCKTDTEFSEKWGLKIKERELSRQERSDYYYKYGNSEGIVEGSLDLPIWVNDETAYKWYDKRNVPNKLITITYNDKTIESYE